MHRLITASALAIVAAGAATAQVADECREVSLSDVGWTDITTTTAIATHVLQGLGYTPDVKVLSVPVTFASLENDDIDVFLGNWMPSQTQAIQSYLDSGEIEQVAVNLEGTKYNLAVPAYTYEKGLQTYEDLADFADELDGTIYGIEPGNEANVYLIGLTEEDRHGMGALELRESSEQGMLAQVARAVDDEEDVVFLGWEPHPMNANFDLEYLEGGEDFFGGEGQVHTVTRQGYSEECPNMGRLLEQMTFTLPMENEIMGAILDDGQDPAAATEEWLQANPEVIEPWLEGVTTVEGEEGLPAVRAELGIGS